MQKWLNVGACLFHRLTLCVWFLFSFSSFVNYYLVIFSLLQIGNGTEMLRDRKIKDRKLILACINRNLIKVQKSSSRLAKSRSEVCALVNARWQIFHKVSIILTLHAENCKIIYPINKWVGWLAGARTRRKWSSEKLCQDEASALFLREVIKCSKSAYHFATVFFVVSSTLTILF